MSDDLVHELQSFDRAGLLRRGAALGAALGFAGLLPRLADAHSEANVTLNLVAYSTPKAVMAAQEAAYQATAQGTGVSFTNSFGPSTNQANAVAAGQPADLVFLSWPGDVQILVNSGLVNSTWDEQSYHGILANTVVVFALRDGNPKRITQWSDLIKPGVQVITPDPFSSGSAKWNVLAAYASQRHLGKSDAQAIAYVKALFKNVVAQPTSGSNATAAFEAGEGDVLITFEAESITANQAAGSSVIQYVIPKQTLLVQLPVAVIKSSPNENPANLFIQYLKQEPAQVVFGQKGFRPVNAAAAKQFKFPVRPGEITINDPVLGGYTAAQQRWFTTGGLMDQIESAVGGPTA
jgi:sulfate/thiosulfate transport system substrate-binding protein